MSEIRFDDRVAVITGAGGNFCSGGDVFEIIETLRRHLADQRPERAEIDRRTWMDRGEAVCALVYGGQYERLRANVRSLHPDMEHWMVEEGYGKVLGRPGLSLLERELCIVALLAVLDVPRQLYSHLRGALNLGGSEEAVDGALEVGLQYAEPAARQRARETWVALRSRTELGG